MRPLGRWLRRRAENIAALMLAVMFGAFVLQIAFRYLFNFPVGWTSELTVIMWLWLVLFGAAFVVKERDEIRFDLLQGFVGRRGRIAMGLVAAIALLVLYARSLPASYAYVSFMKVEKSAYLKIRMDWLFSIYVVFLVAIVVRYLWIASRLLRGKDDEQRADTDEVASGL
jgi:TRAP-type C4-dicarboxylate transport system permease small subunit